MLFLLAVYSYFKYWGGLQAVDDEEDDIESGGNQSIDSNVRKMSTKILNE